MCLLFCYCVVQGVSFNYHHRNVRSRSRTSRSRSRLLWQSLGLVSKSEPGLGLGGYGLDYITAGYIECSHGPYLSRGLQVPHTWFPALCINCFLKMSDIFAHTKDTGIVDVIFRFLRNWHFLTRDCFLYVRRGLCQLSTCHLRQGSFASHAGLPGLAF